MKNLYTNYLKEMKHYLEAVAYEELGHLITALMDAFWNDRMIFLAGNGGSAASALHFQEDISFGSLKGTGIEKRFKVICLCNSEPYLTTLANDLSYQDVFSEQLKNFARPDDLFIGISCSGNSPNILRCLEFCNEQKLKTFSLLGFTGGKAAQLSDHSLIIRSEDYGLIESIHSFLLHYVVVEINDLFKKGSRP